MSDWLNPAQDVFDTSTPPRVQTAQDAPAASPLIDPDERRRVVLDDLGALANVAQIIGALLRL